MKKEEVDQLLERYASKEGLCSEYHTWLGQSSQYDDVSAAINYSFVRHFKPQVVVEFGARTARCTHDILRALLKNKLPFVFKPYELEEPNRKLGQDELDRVFGKKSIKIGGDILKADDLPDDIDYLFIDNYHDVTTTKWVFDTLIKKCKPNALIQIHDIALKGDFEPIVTTFPEQDVIINMHRNGTLPLEKLFWASEHYGTQASWWRLK